MILQITSLLARCRTELRTTSEMDGLGICLTVATNRIDSTSWVMMITTAGQMPRLMKHRLLTAQLRRLHQLG